jgi:hypothetical protein
MFFVCELLILHKTVFSPTFCLVFNLVNCLWNIKLFFIQSTFTVPDVAKAYRRIVSKKTIFTCILINIDVKIIVDYLCRLARGACLCWCMYSENTHFCLWHYLNQNRTAHTQSASVWIAGSRGISQSVNFYHSSRLSGCI